LRARYNQHVAGGFRGSELSLKFADRHKFLTAACAEAGIFWEGLVLDEDGRDTRRGIPWHDVGDVHGIAETGVDIGDDRASCTSPIARIISRWISIERILASGTA